MQFRKTSTLLSLLLCGLAATAQVRVQNPRIENLTDPIGLDVAQPRFGWQLAAERRNVLQTAYEIRVAAGSSDLAAGNNFWARGMALLEARHIPAIGSTAYSSLFRCDRRSAECAVTE